MKAKLLLVAIASWLAGLIPVLIVSHLFVDRLSFEDFMGFTVISFMTCLLVITLLYLPGLYWLKRRMAGSRSPLFFALIAALVLNIPVIAFAVFQAGRSFARSEAALFICLFAVTGLVFGAGFARVSSDQKS